MLRLDDVLSSQAVMAVRNGVLQEPLLPTDYGDSISSLAVIQELERPQRKELERMATSIVFNNFPIFMGNKEGIRVKAKLVDYILPPDVDVVQPVFRSELIDEYKKRKLINMITQGSGVNTHGIHHIHDQFKEANPELVSAYDRFDRINRKRMRSTPDAMMSSMPLEIMERARILGVVRLEHKGGKWTIHAEALMMPVLIHEIIKGMYELMGMYGLPEDYELSQKVMEFTDTKKDEVIDLKYGEVLYSLVRDYVRNNFHEFTDRKPEVLEYYLQHHYQKEPREMVEFFDRMLTGRLDLKVQRALISGIYRDIERDEAEI